MGRLDLQQWGSKYHFPPRQQHQVPQDDAQTKVLVNHVTDKTYSVGKGVVAALRHPDASVDRALKIQSFVATPNEILAAFEKQTGAQWTVEYSSLDKLRAVEERLWAEGKPIATGATLRRIWGEGGTLYERTDNEDIGLGADEVESLEDAVRGAVQKAV